MDNGTPTPQSTDSTGTVRKLLWLLIGLLVVLIALLSAYLVQRPGGPSAVATDQVSVIVPVKAPGLDVGGSRIPVSVSGTTTDGTPVDKVAYLEADGSGLSLSPGTYQVATIGAGSPIARDGTVYHVSRALVDVDLTPEAIEAGTTTPVDNALEYSPAGPEDVTQQMVDDAVELMRKDDARKDLVDALEQKARERYREALNGASASGDSNTTGQADAQKTGDANAQTSGHIVSFEHFDFAMPPEWQDDVTFMEGKLFGTQECQWLEYRGGELLASPIETFDSSNIRPLATYTTKSDISVTVWAESASYVLAYLSDAQGRSATISTLVVTPEVAGVMWDGTAEDATAINKMQEAILGSTPYSNGTDRCVDMLCACAERITLT
ncbi:MAG: hypothetical protein Q4A01_06155 [Coriobacteriales bacterium]|nr:hypothetical protein [Coriobacteriales bacterium]